MFDLCTSWFFSLSSSLSPATAIRGCYSNGGKDISQPSDTVETGEGALEL